MNKMNKRYIIEICNPMSKLYLYYAKKDPLCKRICQSHGPLNSREILRYNPKLFIHSDIAEDIARVYCKNHQGYTYKILEIEVEV